MAVNTNSEATSTGKTGQPKALFIKSQSGFIGGGVVNKNIEVVTARMHKLDPSKPYLIALESELTQYEMDLLSTKLKEFGLEKAVVVAGKVKISEIKNASN